MSVILDLLKDNLTAVLAAPLSFVLVLVISIGIAYKLATWYQGGEAKHLKIEKLGLESKVKKLELELQKPQRESAALTVQPVLSSGNAPQEVNIFLRRQEIHWDPFNLNVFRRFWVAGTSLVGVAERDLFTNHTAKGINDIRLILPSTEPRYVSYHQLHQFDLMPGANLVHDQVDAAKQAFRMLSKRVVRIVGSREPRHLRRYHGIMYANITIFDDDAFFSPYDSSGLGDSNITLQFNAKTNPSGFKYVEAEFLRMWDADPTLGHIPQKRLGASIILINGAGAVLFYLRDQKVTIPFPNCWDLLGGHVESGESPEQCIKRELKEEIGYDIGNPRLFDAFDMQDRIEYTFWKTTDLDISKTTLTEGQRLCWFTETELGSIPDNQIAFDFKPILRQFYVWYHGQRDG